jgi:hypothetical protein
LIYFFPLAVETNVDDMTWFLFNHFRNYRFWKHTKALTLKSIIASQSSKLLLWIASKLCVFYITLRHQF